MGVKVVIFHKDMEKIRGMKGQGTSEWNIIKYNLESLSLRLAVLAVMDRGRRGTPSVQHMKDYMLQYCSMRPDSELFRGGKCK